MIFFIRLKYITRKKGKQKIQRMVNEIVRELEENDEDEEDEEEDDDILSQLGL
jgi:hypothetical protein